MGKQMVALVARKPSLELAGVIDTSPDQVGKDVSEILGLKDLSGVTVSGSAEELFRSVQADVVLHAITSFARVAWPQIEHAVRNGCDVITIAEEMAYVAAQHPALAEEIDALARTCGVTILGTGVNPGYVLDTLVVSLTAVCSDVRRITATGMNDLAPFGPTVLQTQGVGTTVEEFERGLADGSIVGHVGFPESLSMIAKRLGWQLDEIRQYRESIVARARRTTPHVVVEPGRVAGCRHTAKGLVGGQVVVELIHPQ